MGASDEFVGYVVDQLAGWGEISVRRMFGGAGLYREGTMFGLIADDVAYLKVDDSNRDDFLRAGSSAFRPYPDKAKSTIMSYFEIPADVLENPDELGRWAQRSWTIARKKQRAKVTKGDKSNDRENKQMDKDEK
jgi:DNA transformation protein